MRNRRQVGHGVRDIVRKRGSAIVDADAGIAAAEQQSAARLEIARASSIAVSRLARDEADGAMAIEIVRRRGGCGWCRPRSHAPARRARSRLSPRAARRSSVRDRARPGAASAHRPRPRPSRPAQLEKIAGACHLGAGPRRGRHGDERQGIGRQRRRRRTDRPRPAFPRPHRMPPAWRYRAPCRRRARSRRRTRASRASAVAASMLAYLGSPEKPS